jgi:hypothetical protein
MFHSIPEQLLVSQERPCAVSLVVPTVFICFLSLNFAVLILVRQISIQMREMHQSITSFLSSWHIHNFGLVTLTVIWYERSVEGKYKLPVDYVAVTKTILWHCVGLASCLWRWYFCIFWYRAWWSCCVNFPEHTLWFTLLAVSDERRKAEAFQWRLTFIYIVRRKSVPTFHRTQSVFIRNSNRFMLFMATDGAKL